MPSAIFAASREAVLQRVQSSPLKPTSLLADLGQEYSYTEIQDALSDLLERGDVVLTSELELKPGHKEETVEGV